MLRRCAALLLCLVAGGAARAQESPPELSDEQRAALEWLGAVGVPDVSGRRFVRIECVRDGDAGTAWSVWGFLLDDTPESVSVTGLGMATEHVRRAGLELRVVDEPLAEYVDRLLAQEDDAGRDTFPIKRAFEGHVDLPPVGELAYLAAVCAARGLGLRAAALLGRAERLESGELPDVEEATLLEKLRTDMDTPVFWRTLLLFQDRAQSRPRIAEAFRHYLDCFPRGRHRERAGDTLRILDRMIRQDEARAASLKPWEAMTEEEQIADLIHQLRDQPGGQFMQPGAPYFYGSADENGGVEPPIARLEAMGAAAVPQLIEALDDDEFTRCIGFHRDFYFSHYVERVGDAALDALSGIAGTAFYVRRSTSGAMWKDGEAAATREVVEAWWREYREKGELQMRIDQVRKGGASCRSALAWLIENAPEAAADAAAEGLRNAGEGRFVSDLVQELRALKTTEATRLLVAALDDPRSEAARTYAAIELLRRGDRAAFATIERGWERLAIAGDRLDAPFVTPDVAGAFLEFADLARIQSLAAGYAALSEAQRAALVHALHSEWIYARTSADRQRAFDDILLAALEDPTYVGTWWSTNSVREVRRCDDAARELFRRHPWPGIEGVPPANLADRGSWLLAARNAVRAERELSPADPPAPLPEGAFIVGEIAVTPSGDALPEPIAAALDASRGGAIDREHVERLLSAIVRSSREQPGALRVVVTRFAGRRARLLVTYTAASERDTGWETGTFAQVGHDTVVARSTFGTTATAFPEEARERLLSMVDLVRAHDDVETASVYVEFSIACR